VKVLIERIMQEADALIGNRLIGLLHR
jgi:hypothetical protein